ncbi:MAG: hypothetical protein K2H86_04240 [Muribaculaceae bacterium]|nr:hypothetical protein [Muribaculaceae bacterium]
MSSISLQIKDSSTGFQSGWKKYDAISSHCSGEYDTVKVGNTLMKVYRNDSDHAIFLWNNIAKSRQHLYLKSLDKPAATISLVSTKWPVKRIELLSIEQLAELNKLNFGLNISPERLIFGEVSDNQTTCIALDLGYGIRVRITAYYGDFDTYYLSFFEGDDIIRQEHLDLDNTIAGINNVLRELHREAARRNVTI